MRFEIEVELNGVVYEYFLALELEEGTKELRVREESLSVDGNPAFTRDSAVVYIAPRQRVVAGADYMAGHIDWHLVALPIMQERSQQDPLFRFKQFLAHMLILGPIPSLISGDSDHETLQPDVSVSNFGA